MDDKKSYAISSDVCSKYQKFLMRTKGSVYFKASYRIVIV